MCWNRFRLVLAAGRLYSFRDCLSHSPTADNLSRRRKLMRQPRTLILHCISSCLKPKKKKKSPPKTLGSAMMLLLANLYISIPLFAHVIASSAYRPTCYEDGAQLPAPAAPHCARAMSSIRNDRSFTTPLPYGADEDPPRNTPIDWSYKSCLLTIDADDGSYTDTFALSSTMPSFAAVEELCVVRKKPGQGFGGYIPIGHGRTFFAIVQFNPEYLPENLGLDVFSSANGTRNATVSGSVDTA